MKRKWSVKETFLHLSSVIKGERKSVSKSATGYSDITWLDGFVQGKHWWAWSLGGPNVWIVSLADTWRMLAGRKYPLIRASATGLGRRRYWSSADPGLWVTWSTGTCSGELQCSHARLNVTNHNIQQDIDDTVFSVKRYTDVLFTYLRTRRLWLIHEGTLT